MNKAVFLDRDGVINEVHTRRVRYVNSPNDVYLLPGAAEAIKQLNNAGYMVFIVTNQGGIALGYMKEEALFHIHLKLLSLLYKEAGAQIDDIAYCPNSPLEYSTSDCRKPNPRMILDLAEKYKVDLKESFTVGDMRSDITAGNNAHTRTILIIDPGEIVPVIDESFVAVSLLDAVDQILKMAKVHN